MGKLSLGKMLDCLCLNKSSCSCFCLNTLESGDDIFEKKPFTMSEGAQLLRLKDVVSDNQTLAFQLKPKVCKYFLLKKLSLYLFDVLLMNH